MLYVTWNPTPLAILAVVIWNEANVEAPTQTGVVTLLSVAVGRATILNVTSPL